MTSTAGCGKLDTRAPVTSTKLPVVERALADVQELGGLLDGHQPVGDPDGLADVLHTVIRQPPARPGTEAPRLLGMRTADEQAELLVTTSKADPGTAERKFYELARTEAIRGYYTTAAGLNELDYRGNAYYGDCPGCEGKL